MHMYVLVSQIYSNCSIVNLPHPPIQETVNLQFMLLFFTNVAILTLTVSVRVDCNDPLSDKQQFNYKSQLTGYAMTDSLSHVHTCTYLNKEHLFVVEGSFCFTRFFPYLEVPLYLILLLFFSFIFCVVLN